MENPITFTALNDFIFCPASIFYHGLYEGVENLLFKGESQLKGEHSHKNIDNNTWTQSNVICGQTVYSEKYALIGKIDKYYPSLKILVESKREIKTIYDGYVFQLYAQYFAMLETGFEVEKLYLYSIVNHKKYEIPLPEKNPKLFSEFEEVVENIRKFSLEDFKPANLNKCDNCIYSAACEWGRSS